MPPPYEYVAANQAGGIRWAPLEVKYFQQKLRLLIREWLTYARPRFLPSLFYGFATHQNCQGQFLYGFRGRFSHTNLEFSSRRLFSIHFCEIQRSQHHFHWFVWFTLADLYKPHFPGSKIVLCARNFAIYRYFVTAVSHHLGVFPARDPPDRYGARMSLSCTGIRRKTPLETQNLMPSELRTLIYIINEGK